MHYNNNILELKLYFNDINRQIQKTKEKPQKKKIIANFKKEKYQLSAPTKQFAKPSKLRKIP